MLFFTLFQLLCSVSLPSLASGASSTAKTSDAEKLLSFKSSLHRPQSKHSPKLATSSVSSHLFSIEQLIFLNLNSANISGSLDPFSVCSPSLAEINLSENSISGPFSDVSNFGSCPGLKHLNLSSNLLVHSKDLRGSHFGLSLETLDVSANHLLSGYQVLHWVLSGGCAYLSHLSLAGNKLWGSFSLSGCTHLEYLDLSSNNFSIPIPNFRRYCPNLRYLDLSSNKFFGDIGDAFAGLKSLSYLNVSNNNFQGVIPDSFADKPCSTLVELDLSRNNFSGMISSSFGSCSLLETFDISSNNFSGDLPMENFLKIGKLKKLALAFNNFVGTLPDSVSSLSNLEVLDLSSNKISGKIPPGICENSEGGGTNLKELYLQNNLLTGFIPPTLGNCSRLVSLDLSFNYLSGRIPSSLGSLAKLKDLIMWMNQLEGDIPSELMYNLEHENLILDYNELTGTIPSGLSNCTDLNWISLSSNKLSGQIPSWIGRLAKLAILKLNSNSFDGQIPPELGDCKSLVWLDLNSNFLSGSIPSTLAKQSGLMVGKKYVYLRNARSEECRGIGNLLEFAGIRQEAIDRISTRNTCNFIVIYRGDTQPTFNHDGSMIFLDLSFNHLESSIPKELGSMSYLSVLNLGHNNLSGPIPAELRGLRDIGVLDLSHNQLTGQIPESLDDLTLTDIDLSNNQLYGLIPHRGQVATFPRDRFVNNSGLCGYPLPCCGCLSGSQAGAGAGGDSLPSNKSHVYFDVGLYVSIVLGFIVGFWAFIGTLALKDCWRRRYFRSIELIIDWIYVKVAVQANKFQRKGQSGLN